MNRDKRERFYRKRQKRDEAFMRWLNNSPEVMARVALCFNTMTESLGAFISGRKPSFMVGGYTSMPDELMVICPRSAIDFHYPMIIATYPHQDEEQRKRIEEFKRIIEESSLTYQMESDPVFNAKFISDIEEGFGNE